MAIIPPVLLILSAIAVWIASARYLRMKWTVVAMPMALAWVGTLVLFIALPSEVSLSAWRPEELFQSSLMLSLDITSWRFIAVGVAVVLAFYVSGIEGEKEASRSVQAAILVYAAFAALAILAANLLTVVMAWTLMDVLESALHARLRAGRGARRGVVRRLAVESVGVILAMIAVSASVSSGGGDELTSRMASPLVGGMLAGALVMRVCCVPAVTEEEGESRQALDYAMLSDLLRSGAAFSAVGRLYSLGLPDELVLVLGIGGVTFALVGGARWMLKADAARGRWDMMLGITGVALVSSSLVPDDAGLPMVSGGLSLMIVVALVGLWRGQRAWQRIWPVIAGLMVAGLPWGVSTWLSLGLLSSLMEGKNVGLAIGGWLGLVLLVVGIARMVMGRESSLRGRTELPEAMREAGKLVLVFTSAVIAQGMKGLGGAYAWVGFGAVGVVATLAVLGFRRLPASVVRRMNTLGTWVVGDGVQETLKVGANRVLRWSRAVVGTLEGEGGMLWVYVVLLFVVMAIGGG